MPPLVVGYRQAEIGTYAIRLISVGKIRGVGNRFQGLRLRMANRDGMQFYGPAERKSKYSVAYLIFFHPKIRMNGQNFALNYRFEQVQVESCADYRGDVVVEMEFRRFLLQLPDGRLLADSELYFKEENE